MFDKCITPEQLGELRAERARGATVANLAGRYGLSLSTVRVITFTLAEPDAERDDRWPRRSGGGQPPAMPPLRAGQDAAARAFDLLVLHVTR